MSLFIFVAFFVLLSGGKACVKKKREERVLLSFYLRWTKTYVQRKSTKSKKKDETRGDHRIGQENGTIQKIFFIRSPRENLCKQRRWVALVPRT